MAGRVASSAGRTHGPVLHLISSAPTGFYARRARNRLLSVAGAPLHELGSTPTELKEHFSLDSEQAGRGKSAVQRASAFYALDRMHAWRSSRRWAMFATCPERKRRERTLIAHRRAKPAPRWATLMSEARSSAILFWGVADALSECCPSCRRTTQWHAEL